MTKYHTQMWQFSKVERISETAAHRVKIRSISTPEVEMEYMCNFLELWQMAKLVLKQSVKAHGPDLPRAKHQQPSQPSQKGDNENSKY